MFVGIYALAMLMLLVMGILDLAITSYGIFAAYLTLTFCMKYWMSVSCWTMLVISAVIGALCAMVTGLVIYKFRLPGILVSIRMANIYYMRCFWRATGRETFRGI